MKARWGYWSLPLRQSPTLSLGRVQPERKTVAWSGAESLANPASTLVATPVTTDCRGTPLRLDQSRSGACCFFGLHCVDSEERA